MIKWISIFFANVFLSYVALMYLSTLGGSGTDMILVFIALQLCFVSTLIFYVIHKTEKVEMRLKWIERQLNDPLNEHVKEE